MCDQWPLLLFSIFVLFRCFLSLMFVVAFFIWFLFLEKFGYHFFFRSALCLLQLFWIVWIVPIASTVGWHLLNLLAKYLEDKFVDYIEGLCINIVNSPGANTRCVDTFLLFHFIHIWRVDFFSLWTARHIDHLIYLIIMKTPIIFWQLTNCTNNDTHGLLTLVTKK